MTSASAERTRNPRAGRAGAARRQSSSITDRLTYAVGGRLRARILLLLACVLALDTADSSMIGAIAGQLERALRLSNIQLGLLASVPALFAAVATIPIGVLTDRVTRVRLMGASTLIWAAAMAASGLAGSFETLVLRADPTRLPLWKAARYVLRVKTNVILIVASALGYFYFTGIQTFGLVLFTSRYGVSHGVATLLFGLIGLGALVGVVGGGRLADRLVDRGRVNGRVAVGGASFILAAAAFLVALLGHSLVLSLPFYVGAGAAFAARNPALDAARLDVMHHALWGRAEAVRTLLRRVVVGTAPLLFGLLADRLASSRVPAGGGHGFGANDSATGLYWAFLLLLVTLVLSGLLTLVALRTYPRDVATADASEEATAADRDRA